MAWAVTVLRFALRMLGTCPHENRYRERLEGVLMLTCETCAHSVPALNRTKAELRQFRKVRPSYETMKARPAHPAKVISLGRAK